MKAPDTIYLSPLLVEGCGKNLSKRVTENDAVYIREDLIKAEIEGRMKEHKDWSSFYHSRGKHSDFEKGAIFALNRVLHFIDNLCGEKSTRQRLAEWSKTPEGRESYEKVAEEMRREISEKPMNLDELLKEAQRYYSDNFAYITSDQPTLSILTNIARHFAKWGADHTPLPEDTVLFNKGVEEGKRLMMEEAVSIIESRLSEIIGDAQPKPILRAELQELIKQIKDEK